MATHKLSEIVSRVGGALVRGSDREIDGVAPVQDAGPRQLTFLDNTKAMSLLGTTRAGAVLVKQDAGAATDAAVIEVSNVRLALAKALELYCVHISWGEGVDPAAVVDASAKLGAGVCVAAGAIVGAKCVIGDGSRIDPGVVLYPGVAIGRDCHIQARVVVRENVVIGDRVILQPGVVIGGDGFGFVLTPEHTHYKIPHLGLVIIEEDVEIGANSCIDRGTMGVTRVRRGAKLDNLVQVAHNCEIGEHAILCGQVGIAGSCRIEHHVVIGGQAGLAGHMTVGAGSQIGAQSGLHKDVPPGSGLVGTPAMEGRLYAQVSALLPKLPGLFRRMRRLERASEEGATAGAKSGGADD